MKKLLFGMVLIASASCFATEITPDNIAGTFEAKVLTPSPENFGVQAYIVQYDLYADGTLSYREYHNEERTIGILGNDEIPPCKGTYTLENNILKTITDCSMYSGIYHQEINLNQVALEDITDGNSTVVESSSTLAPGVVMTSEVKKL